jgi:protein involved in polysaccharide export with SLBB domain
VAVGMTPDALQKDLAQRYSSQLVSKEVTVTIASATFPVFVTGSVLKPGRYTSDHPITVLEAVMEAGGFDATKANTEAVVVIRQESGGTKNYTVNLKAILEGKSNTSFYLNPSDIVYVPEKFTWF